MKTYDKNGRNGGRSLAWKILVPVVVGLLLATLGFLQARVWAHESRVSRLEAQTEVLNLKLDLVLDHFGIPKPQEN